MATWVIWSKLKQESYAIAKMTARHVSGSNEPLRRYGYSKLSKMAACRQLGFDVTGNCAIPSADPENPTLEPNMKCIRSPLRRYGHLHILRAYRTPILGEWDRYCDRYYPHYASTGNSDCSKSVRPSVRPSVCHEPVLCQNKES